ncbi:CHAP domain-containing protein [Nocardioides montaniterrae]
MFTRGLLALALAAGVGAAVGVAPAHAVGYGTVKPNYTCVNLRSSTTTSSTALVCIPKGTRLAIDCTLRGQSVTGPDGTTSLWDHTTYAGKRGYVSDAVLATGTSNPVAPTCSPQPPPTSSSALSARVDAFVSRYGNGTQSINVDGRYGSQCVDLANLYHQIVVRHYSSPSASRWVAGDGRDWWGLAAAGHPLAPYYKRVSASSLARKGDIAVWYSGSHGHVAVVLRDQTTAGSALHVYTQTGQQTDRYGNPTGPKTYAHISDMGKAFTWGGYSYYVLGYLRPLS